MNSKKWPHYPKISNYVAILCLVSWGCSSSVDLLIRIVFPNPETKEQAGSLQLFAIEPSEGTDCDLLKKGVAANYKVEAQVVIQLPTTDPLPLLEDVGPGLRYFFAQITNQEGQLILVGCTELQAGAEGVEEVVIALEDVTLCRDVTDCDDGIWCNGDETCEAGQCIQKARNCSDEDFCTEDVCNEQLDQCDHPRVTEPPAVEGPVGDPSCSDEKDNDCDGFTDLEDTACKSCTLDNECDDLNDCTTDSCPGGTCKNDPVNNDTNCNDGDECSSLDSCQEGKCTPGDTNKDTDQDNFYDAQCPGGDDCNDADAAINPGATEGPVGNLTCSDEKDNDCDGFTDLEDTACKSCTLDEDCDDLNDCTADSCPGGTCKNDPVNNDTNCNDGDECSSLDSCQEGKCTSGETDKDTDQDNFFDAQCPGGNDCNDADATINPGITEICDGLDNNCDGSTDEGVNHLWVHDYDGDGYTNNSDFVWSCDDPDGAGNEWVEKATANDCNDNNPNLPKILNISNGTIFDTNTELQTFFTGTTGCFVIRGDLKIYFSTDIVNVDILNGLIAVEGSLLVVGNEVLTNINGLQQLQTVQYGLSLGMWMGDPYNQHFGNPQITSIAGLASLMWVGGNFTLQFSPNLASLAGLENLKRVEGHFLIQYNDTLSDITALSGLEEVGVSDANERYFWLEGLPAVDDLGALGSLRYVGGSLGINDLPLLQSLNGLQQLQVVGGSIYIEGNDVLTDLSALSNLEGDLSSFYIKNNPSLITLNGLQKKHLSHTLNLSNNEMLSDISALSAAIQGSLSRLILVGNNALANLDTLGNLTSIVPLTEPYSCQDPELSAHECQGTVKIENNPQLKNLSALLNLETIGFELVVNNNDALETMAGLGDLKVLSGDLRIIGNQLLATLSLPTAVEFIGPNFIITNNPSLPTADAQSLANSWASGPGYVIQISGNKP